MTETDSAQIASTPVSAGYRRYALTILLTIYTLNFLDRQIVAILAEPIKNDLHLADWQLGMITGLAFALLYTVAGIPIARAAEIGNRPRIIGAAVGVWSLFTIFSGYTQNFIQLVLCRVGVGIGEAGCSPPAQSLISDYTPRENRASALAIFHLGNPIGGLLGMAMGGVIADLYGWRTAFLLAGIPGIIMAVIVATTLVEPRSRLAADLAARRAARPGFWETMTELKSKRTFWLIAFGAALKAFMAYGTAAFLAPFLLRNHGAELTVIARSWGLGLMGFLGIVLGLVLGVTGTVGTLLGGYLADRYGARDLRAYMSIPAVSTVLAIPFYLTGLFAESAVFALVMFTIPPILNTLWVGPSYAAIQGLVRTESRATAVAIALFIINLIGLGLGPLAVGAMSDILSQVMGLGSAEGMRWSLAIFASLAVIASALFWSGRKSIREEMMS